MFQIPVGKTKFHYFSPALEKSLLPPLEKIFPKPMVRTQRPVNVYSDSIKQFKRDLENYPLKNKSCEPKFDLSHAEHVLVREHLFGRKNAEWVNGSNYTFCRDVRYWEYFLKKCSNHFYAT